MKIQGWLDRTTKDTSTILLALVYLLALTACGGGSSSSDDESSGTESYSIGGSVSGLVGSGLVLQNNSSDDLSISTDGSFTFSSSLDDGASYSVSISTQPTGQSCSVSDGSGSVNAADVADIRVSCAASYSVGGTISGLAGSGLVLQNNSGDELSISANGSFTFSTGIIENDSYSVTVSTQPTSLSQTCSVTNGSGSIGTSDVSNVEIDCSTNYFKVSASVSGLNGSGLKLNNGESSTSIDADGSHVMGNYIDGSSYSIRVATQPSSPNQYCSISGGSGTVSGSAVDIPVTCTKVHSVGGTISGIVGGSTVVLQNNGSDDLSLNSDGSFTFDTEVSEGADYSVEVSIQPTASDQYCNVIYGSDSMSTSNVTDIEVICVDGLYTVVDTNQTDCYESLSGDTRSSCSGTGEDGEYSGNQPSYTSYTIVTDESVVLDDHTGLMWQASSDTDGVSGLDDNDKMTYSDAVSYCSALDYGSYSDWRLPNIKELYSIYLMSGYDLSGEPGAISNGTTVDHTGIPPFIDTTHFDVGYGDTANGERAIDGQYLSSTVNVSQVMSGISSEWTDAIFGLNFVDGHLKSYEKEPSGVNDATYYVRCVRGNTQYGNNDFTDNSDSTITDNASSLMWQQDDSHADDFGDAIDICDASTTGGYSDWRLPNVKELHSIVDYTSSPAATGNPSVDTTYFNSTSFTNEAGNNPDYAYYWSSSALLSSQGKGNSGAYITFGRGLGYINSTIVDVHGAGAQRGDGKTSGTLSSLTAIDVSGTGATFGDTAYTNGPQGDINRIVNNYVRCVRDN